MDSADKKKIALFMPSLANGGAERVMLNIARGIAARNDYVVDIVLVRAEGPYLEEAQQIDNVRVVDLNCSRIIASVMPVVRYLRRSSPEAVLCALDTTNLVMLWAARLACFRNPVVVSVHCNFSAALEGAKNVRARLIPWLVRVSYRNAERVVCVSQGVADDMTLSTGIDEEKLEVIVNPVITAELVAAASAKPSHPWLEKQNKKPVIVAVGRLTHQKNFSVLIDAFSDLLESMPARLIIFGEGDEREMLEAKIEKLGLGDVIDLPGFVANPHANFKAADLFVMSSRYEGLPTVLIEALYCGATIVSTDCPSGPREILEDGALGTLVPVDDRGALGLAMLSVLEARANTAECEPVGRDLSRYYEGSVVSEYLRVLKL